MRDAHRYDLNNIHLRVLEAPLIYFYYFCWPWRTVMKELNNLYYKQINGNIAIVKNHFKRAH